jgi:long-chain acyl-CoA synthetase
MPKAAPHGSAATLFGRLEAVCARAPNKVAIARGDTTLTYEALVSRARALSAELAGAGVQPLDRVAVILPNGPEFAIAAYAIWQLGATVLPLHVRFQEEEIQRYVLDCGVRTIITTQRLQTVVESMQRKAVGIEHAWLCTTEDSAWRYVGGAQTQPTRPPLHRAPLHVEPSSAALTQYSTGSTGFPKRVTRTHQQLLGEFDAIAEVMGITERDRILGVAPFFHNYGLMNVLLCGTLSGAAIHTMDDFFARDAARLVEAAKITGFPGVPFMHQLLADLRGAADLSNLRYVLSAGAPLSAATADAFKAAFGVSIRQLYGSTETGVISIEAASASENLEPSVGYPIPGVSVRIVDENGRDVPGGAEGQVAVASKYAASTYENVEGRGESHFTDGRFFPGDIGSLGADGRLTLSGRKRQFINVAGNKVDPVEVESVLREMPMVREVVVVGVPDGAAGEKLKAVMVTSSAVTRKEVLDHCSAKLADFKRPRVIEFRTEIPKSPLGKILRKYLIENYNEQKPRYVFDPRTGFAIKEPGATPEDTVIDLSTVTPFLRALLVTDGTVTKNLEAYFWEPIEVELLSHAEEQSDRAYPEIGVPAQATIVRRRVVLRGRMTGSAYVFADTVMTTAGVSEDLRRSLVDERKGIGELLRARRLETYRELVGVERAVAGEWAGHLGLDPSANVVVRRYTIYLQQRPAMLIAEVFSIDRFES